MNVARWLERAAERAPGKIAAISEGTQALTYGELDAAASRLGTALRALGIGPGERVSFMLANSLEYCRSKITAFKVPRIVEMVRELPKTATGKILRPAGHGPELR